MTPNPLEPPESPLLLEEFRFRHRVGWHSDVRRTLSGLVRAFARLPYENLTKIIKQASLGPFEASRRLPAEVLADNARWGTGGTCFSLTAALLHLVRSLGLRSEPILADRRYGPNTHCAALVWLEERPHLLDPGYLLVDPILLPECEDQVISTPFHQVELHPRQDGALLDLTTIVQGQRQYRLTYRTAPVDPGEFMKAWDSSFDWEMMRYPVCTRVGGDRQIYLRGQHYQVRQASGVERTELPAAELVSRITREFGLHPTIIQMALEVLRERGELRG